MLALFFLVVISAFTATLGAKQPNIIFILADDYGYNDIGYHSSVIRTPVLDQLASSGVKLENYYVQPICTPTRSQLMSGRYQIHTGLQHGIIWANQANGLPLEDLTIADRLKASGYSTHIVGKWHLGFYKEEYTPWKRGFDTFYGYLTGSEDYYTHVRCDTFAGKRGCGLDLRSETSPDHSQSGSYSAHIFTQRAVDIINKHNATDKPLFLYLPYQSVHAPLQVPDRYTRPYTFIKDRKRRTYAGMVTAMDEGIGNLTEALKRSGLYENTIIVFSNDNGGQILEGGNNWPLRGWKGSLWEGGLRGVGFVHSPLLDPSLRGTTNRDLLHVSDWYPTLVSLGGGNYNATGIDGIDAWPAITRLTGGRRRTEILHNIDPLTAKAGSPRSNSPFDVRVRSAIRSGPWKLITGYPGNSSWIPPPEYLVYGRRAGDELKSNVWLFNIEADPEERNEVSSENPEVVHDLLSRLAFYNSTAVPVNYPPFDPKANPELYGGVWQPWM